MRIISLLILVLFSTSAAFAQSKVGTSIVDGKPVELFDDGTWQFREAGDTDCQALAPQLNFCDVTGQWKRVAVPPPDVLAQFRLDDRNYGQFIVENLGYEDGLTLEFMRTAVIENAAAAAQLPVSEIVVYSAQDNTIQDMTSATVVYGMNFKNLPVVFYNSIAQTENRTVQIVTFAVAKGPTDASDERHNQFVESTKLD